MAVALHGPAASLHRPVAQVDYYSVIDVSQETDQALPGPCTEGTRCVLVVSVWVALLPLIAWHHASSTTHPPQDLWGSAVPSAVISMPPASASFPSKPHPHRTQPLGTLGGFRLHHESPARRGLGPHIHLAMGTDGGAHFPGRNGPVPKRAAAATRSLTSLCSALLLLVGGGWLGRRALGRRQRFGACGPRAEQGRALALGPAPWLHTSPPVPLLRPAGVVQPRARGPQGPPWAMGATQGEGLRRGARHGRTPCSTGPPSTGPARAPAALQDPLRPRHVHFAAAFLARGLLLTAVSPRLQGPELEPKGDGPPHNGRAWVAEHEKVNTADMRLSWAAFRPFFKVAIPFFRTDRTARRSLFLVAALTLLNSGVTVTFTFIQRGFWTALSVREQEKFYTMISRFGVALLCGIPISVLYTYKRERLALYWREHLTAEILRQYYAHNTFYALETLRDIDNPDQRIADDVRAFTTTSLEFFITVFTGIVDLLSFSAILFRIYPGLFAAIVMYSGMGTIVASRLGTSLVGLRYKRLIREADFRYALIRTRENAEAIAFYDKEASLERGELWRRFDLVLSNSLSILRTQRNLEVFTTGYRYIVQVPLTPSTGLG